MVAICVVIAVHVGFGIEYLEVQNAWALECVLSCWKKTYGTFVHSGPATTCWTTTASAITVAEYSIFFPRNRCPRRSSEVVTQRHLDTPGTLYIIPKVPFLPTDSQPYARLAELLYTLEAPNPRPGPRVIVSAYSSLVKCHLISALQGYVRSGR